MARAVRLMMVIGGGLGALSLVLTESVSSCCCVCNNIFLILSDNFVSYKRTLPTVNLQVPYIVDIRMKYV